MEPILISVIMPFYNVLPYFREAIESVLDQSYTHWELLLADDGSSDGSTDLAGEYSKKYSGKIKYLCHPEGKHLGTIASRMLAIREATGSYIAFLDADDCWLPGKLDFQIKIIRQYPEAAMICGSTKYWYSWADEQKKDEVIAVGGQQNEIISPPEAAVSLYPLGKGAAPCLCSIVLKKESALQYEKLDLYFSGKYQLYEDQAFLIKIYLAEKIFISSEPMDLYRQRADSNMHALTEAGYYHEVRYYFLKWLKNYLRENQIKDRAVWKKLKEVMTPYKNPQWHKLKTKFGHKMKWFHDE